MAKYVLIFIIFIGVISFFCCSDKGVQGDPATSISGNVVDSITRLPIDSAKICIYDTVDCAVFGYTDSIGYYQYTVFGYQEVLLYCRKEGYRSKSISVTTSKYNTTITDANFELVQRSI